MRFWSFLVNPRTLFWVDLWLLAQLAWTAFDAVEDRKTGLTFVCVGMSMVMTWLAFRDWGLWHRKPEEIA